MRIDTDSLLAAVRAAAGPRSPDVIVAEFQRDVAVDPSRFHRCPRRTCRRRRACSFAALPCADAVLTPERLEATRRELQVALEHAARIERDKRERDEALVRRVLSQAKQMGAPITP